MGLMVSEDRCEKVRGKAVVNLRRKVRLKLQSCTEVSACLLWNLFLSQDALFVCLVEYCS